MASPFLAPSRNNFPNAETEQYGKEVEKARDTAKQAMIATDRALWSALVANWEKLAKEPAALKVKPWAT
jgi:hypothetical protein